MQIPILNGIYTDQDSDIRASYPRNMVPVISQSGVSNGYLRPAEGITLKGTGPGIPRGAINWNENLYRVMGDKLIKIKADGTYTTIGTVSTFSTDLVSMDYSFTHLCVVSNKLAYLYDGTTLTQITDPDLGYVIDVVFIDGYFMFTDGEYLIVNDLTNPFSVSATKYGSSEIDPDPIVALLELRNEVYALNRYSIEVFDNIGGTGFPFQRIEGAHVTKGCIGTHACAVYQESIAFIGGGHDEPPSVWLSSGGRAEKLATREIDLILRQHTETVLSKVKMEARDDKDHAFLKIHLPDQTLVYDMNASKRAGEHVWHILTSGEVNYGQYLARDFVWCYDQWNAADPTSGKYGYTDSTIGSHWGNASSAEFSTKIMYNESRNAVIHELELVGLTGRADLGDDPKISTQYSTNGAIWSQPKSISVGKQGEYDKRLIWLQQGGLTNIRIQKFQLDSAAMLSVIRLEARIEGMAW